MILASRSELIKNATPCEYPFNLCDWTSVLPSGRMSNVQQHHQYFVRNSVYSKLVYLVISSSLYSFFVNNLSRAFCGRKNVATNDFSFSSIHNSFHHFRGKLCIKWQWENYIGTPIILNPILNIYRYRA